MPSNHREREIANAIDRYLTELNTIATIRQELAIQEKEATEELRQVLHADSPAKLAPNIFTNRCFDYHPGDSA